jgi:hypothetical protein
MLRARILAIGIENIRTRGNVVAFNKIACNEQEKLPRVPRLPAKRKLFVTPDPPAINHRHSWTPLTLSYTAGQYPGTSRLYEEVIKSTTNFCVKQCTHCQHFRQHFEQHVDLGDVGENVVSVYRAEAFGNMLCTCCPTCCELNRNQFCCRDANDVAEFCPIGNGL